MTQPQRKSRYSLMLQPQRRKGGRERLNRQDPGLKRIFGEISEHDFSAQKLKPEKLKIQRQQILKYLRKRYPVRLCEKILLNFDFPIKCTFHDYCKAIEDYINKDLKAKLQFGFTIHDVGNNGSISPIDLI